MKLTRTAIFCPIFGRFEKEFFPLDDHLNTETILWGQGHGMLVMEELKTINFTILTTIFLQTISGSSERSMLQELKSIEHP